MRGHEAQLGGSTLLIASCWLLAACSSATRGGAMDADRGTAVRGADGSGGSNGSSTTDPGPSGHGNQGTGGDSVASGTARDASVADRDAADKPTADAASGDGGMTAPTLDGEVSRSGTRVRRVIYDGDGGAVIAIAMHDLQTDVDCRFDRFVDGSLRCIPTEDDALNFSDAACTKGIVFLVDLCPAHPRPSYASHGVATPACGEDMKYETYAVSSRIAQVGATAYSKDANGNCVGSPNERTDGKYYEAEAAAADVWAEATIMTYARGKDAEVEVYASDDGARQLRRVVDLKNNWQCTPDERDPDGHCVPAQIGVAVDVFSDTACSEPAAAYSGCAPGAAYGEYKDTCNPIPLFRIGSAFPPGPYSDHHGGPCTTEDLLPDMVVSQLGAAIDQSELPAIELRASGSGALHALVPMIAGGAIGPAIAFADATGNHCNVESFTDGKSHCLPVNVPIETHYYADANCTASELLYQGELEQPCGAGPYTHVAYFGKVDDCGGRPLEGVHEIGDPYTGADIYGKYVTGDCSGFSLDGAPAARVGPELPLDDFPEVTLHVE